MTIEYDPVTAASTYARVRFDPVRSRGQAMAAPSTSCRTGASGNGRKGPRWSRQAASRFVRSPALYLPGGFGQGSPLRSPVADSHDTLVNYFLPNEAPCSIFAFSEIEHAPCPMPQPAEAASPAAPSDPSTEVPCDGARLARPHPSHDGRPVDGPKTGGETPPLPPSDPRAARLAKFQREQAIVAYLNRGVSVAEIAARFDVGEKRMRAIIREILARRMPAPPQEFVAIQVSRLNEALLVAYSAMTGANLKAVDRVVKNRARARPLSRVCRRRAAPARAVAPRSAGGRRDGVWRGARLPPGICAASL